MENRVYIHTYVRTHTYIPTQLHLKYPIKKTKDPLAAHEQRKDKERKAVFSLLSLIPLVTAVSQLPGFFFS